MNDQIFTMLRRTKFEIYCWCFLVGKYQRYEKNINIYLALASSSSIAAWTIWVKLNWLWAIIITVSQVLTVIKPIFPYFKYAAVLNDKSRELKVLNIEVEELWHKTKDEEITEEEASNAYFDLQRKINDINHFETDIDSKVDEKTKEKAKEELKKFFKNDYNYDLKDDDLD